MLHVIIGAFYVVLKEGVLEDLVVATNHNILSFSAVGSAGQVGAREESQ